MIESLEDRIAPALLAPVVTKGVLLIQHDNASGTNEDVTIHQLGPDTFSITDNLNEIFPNASGVKSINFIEVTSNSTFEFSKDGLAGKLAITLTGGPNTITLTTADGSTGLIKGAVTIHGGVGADSVNLQDGIVLAGTTTFIGGDGSDTFIPDGAYLIKKVTLGSVETITVEESFAPVVIGSLVVENDDQLSGPVTFLLSNVATVLGNLKYCGGVVQTDNVTLNGQFLGPVNLMLLDGENHVTTAGSFNSSLLMTGGAGDDTVTFQTKQLGFDPLSPQYITAHVAGALTMKLGDSTNSVTFDGGSFFEKNISFKGGSGTDTVNFNNFYLAKNLTLSLGDGANTVSATTENAVTNVVRGNFHYTGGGDIDQVGLDHLVAGTLKLSLGNGENKVTGAVQLLGASASIVTGQDNDNVTVSIAGVNTKLSVKLGAGTDTFDFGGGTLGSAALDGGSGLDTLIGQSLLPVKTKIKGFEPTTV